MIRETVVERSNGSKIAVAWVGDPSGRPVLLCHGLADSRLAARPLESAARGLGLCVIAPDRPGMGRTDFRTFRRVSGWTDDARTILAELDVRSVAILGISAGSAFAAACAALLPSRVNKLLLVSPLGEPAWGTRGMATGARLSTLISTWFPAANGWLFARLANLAQRSPERFMRLATGELPSIDRDALARPRDRAAYLAGYLDAFRAGPAGVTQDLRLLRRAWGFELSSIRAPTWVHHGTVDTSVPPLHAHRFAAAIPGAQLVLHPGHGHFSLDLSTAVLEPAFGQGC